MRKLSFLKSILPLSAFCICWILSLYAQRVHLEQAFEEQDGSTFTVELNNRDWEAVVNFTEARRKESAKEKKIKIHISGDVRTEWRHMTEKSNGINIRGNGAVDPFTINPATNPCGLPISRNDFDIECNIRFDYKTDKTWAVAHLQFDNSAGVDDDGFNCVQDPQGYHGSGRCDDICLKRSYFGYNAYKKDATRFDIEVGRRKIYDIFDSRIEFISRFDGILLKYSSEWKNVAEWYWKWGGFVVDERVNHFAWVTEIGFLDIKKHKWDLKYSFIDWNKYGKNRCFVENPLGFRFKISQIILTKHLSRKICSKTVECYAAFLCNHDAFPKSIPALNAFGLPIPERNSAGEIIRNPNGKIKFKKIKKRANLGWYAGVTIGEVKKEGDWSFNIEYEVVQARAIPDDDVSGIGRGNELGDSFTMSRRGNTNYIGWKFEGLYAITDHFNLDSIIEFSRAYDKRFGGSHHYSKFELETIYAF